MDRVKLIQDKIAYNKFIYEMGKQVHDKILNFNLSNDNYLEICKWVAKECDSYPENSYGKPFVHNIMAEAYRRINFTLSEIQAKTMAHE